MASTDPATQGYADAAAAAVTAALVPRIAALENRFTPAEPGGSPGNPGLAMQAIAANCGLGYGDMVDRVSKGQAPPIETIAALLFLNGKTLHDLETDCRRHAGITN